MSAIDKRVNELHRRQHISLLEVQKNAAKQDQEITNAVLIEQNRRILETLQRIESNARPKTSADAIREMRSVMSDAEKQRLLELRVSLASFEECADADAQLQGFANYGELLDETSGVNAMRRVQAEYDANRKGETE